MGFRRVMRRTLALLGVLGLAACGSHFHPETYPTPDALYAASIERFQAGECGDARRGLTRLGFELPAADPRQPDIRFYLAECLFKDGAYLEASREFRRVADEHPDHERAPAALLRSGESLARLWKGPDLDPTYGQQALATFRELLARYPQSDAARAARDRVTDLVDKFALKDIRTGDFYFKLHAYDSAILYYRMVIQQWPDTRLAPRALLRLVAAYRQIDYDEEIRETCEHLRRFYPDQPGLNAQCPASGASAP